MQTKSVLINSKVIDNSGSGVRTLMNFMCNVSLFGFVRLAYNFFITIGLSWTKIGSAMGTGPGLTA